MAKNIRSIARRLGAKVIGKAPDAGGGAFGAARMGASLRDRLTPSRGQRPGRPTDRAWTEHPKVPMSTETMQRLAQLAEQFSTPQRKVSPMHVAAQLLEETVQECIGAASGRG